MTVQIVELVDVQVQASEEVLNVLHYVDEDGVADPAVLLADYVTSVLPLSRPLQSAALQHTQLRWRFVYPTASLQLAYSTGLPISGTDAGELLANCDAASAAWVLSNPTVTLSGGFTGHIMRGGIRLPGMTESMVSGNTMVSGLVAAWRTWSVQLFQPGTDPWKLAVCSFLIGNHVRHGPPRARSHTVTSYTIVGGTTDPAPSTQNSRKILRGRIR